MALYPLVAERVETLALGNFFDVALSQRIAGMAAAAAERWDQADAHFETAHRQAREFPNRIDAPQLQYWHANMLLGRGDPNDRDRAQSMLADALEGYRAYGMLVHAARTQESLR